MTSQGNDPSPARHAVGAPRRPAAVALLVIGAIYLLLPERLSVWPSWLPLAVVVVLLAPLAAARRRGLDRPTRWIALGLIAAATVAVVISAALLVVQVPSGAVPARAFLPDAALIWVAHILTVSVWYWEIDGGGPACRHLDRHSSTDFMLPQQAVGGELAQRWSPGFVDYLFLAFNMSTALSPTDTMVLSRRAKALMMLQSLLSLVVIVVLAARAINTL